MYNEFTIFQTGNQELVKHSVSLQNKIRVGQLSGLELRKYNGELNIVITGVCCKLNGAPYILKNTINKYISGTIKLEVEGVIYDRVNDEEA